MVSLLGFSVLILLTQSNHKSALLFSCTKPLFRCICLLYTLKEKKSNICSYIFRKNQENFSELSTIRKRNGAEHRTKTSRSFTTKARPPREKRRSASGSARTPFRGGSFCLCVFFLFCPLGNGGLILPFERLRFGLFLGVSLSAAARSAAALVYDKLTPNCHLFLNVI